jgi:predicted aspartyl protease
MGFRKVTVLLHGPRGSERVELLADTGAMLTSVPREILERIGIVPFGKRRLKTYGGTVEREAGTAEVEYEGTRAGITVLFGERGDEPILEVTALEALGYEVDPVTKRLRPTGLLMV